MKTCTQCGETRPLDAFYRAKRSADGRMAECKVCNQRRVREYGQRMREELGDEEWRRRRRVAVSRHRAQTDYATERRYGRARGRAVKRLIEAHPDEFAALFNEERGREEAVA